MADQIIIYSIVGIVIAAVGLVAANIWNSRMQKDTNTQSTTMMVENIDKAAKEKWREERLLAQEVAQHNKELAMDIKQDMKNHIDSLIRILKGDIELQRVQAYSQIDKLDTKVQQINIDIARHIEEEKNEHIRIQKSIDFLQTMQFGPEAKSTPPYMEGKVETQTKKDEAYKGVFASREDTTDSQDDDVLATKKQQDKNAETESEEKETK